MFRSLLAAVLHTALVTVTYGVYQSSHSSLLEALAVTFVVAMLLCVPASIIIFGFGSDPSQDSSGRYHEGAGGAAFLWILLLTTAAWAAFLGVSVLTYPLQTIGYALCLCGSVLSLSSGLGRSWRR